MSVGIVLAVLLGGRVERYLVVYEAGPTGFGLARYLIDAGIECAVAAPSKLQRPLGDRVKTDARDARHLARLLHLGEIVAVAIPTVEQEAARDMVRAREDCRGDLMTARHRVSKLLLRQGIVYYGGRACTSILRPAKSCKSARSGRPTWTRYHCNARWNPVRSYSVT